LISGSITGLLALGGVLWTQRRQDERERVADRRRLRDAQTPKLERLYTAMLRTSQDLYDRLHEQARGWPEEATDEASIHQLENAKEVVRSGLILEEVTPEVRQAYESLGKVTRDWSGDMNVAERWPDDDDLSAVRQVVESLKRAIGAHLGELRRQI
jgi:hypothetical protein